VLGVRRQSPHAAQRRLTTWSGTVPARKSLVGEQPLDVGEAESRLLQGRKRGERTHQRVQYFEGVGEVADGLVEPQLAETRGSAVWAFPARPLVRTAPERREVPGADQVRDQIPSLGVADGSPRIRLGQSRQSKRTGENG
jgi:hypothetical protein